MFTVKMSKSTRFTRLKKTNKETTEEFLLSLDLLFDMAHDQATSLISNRPNSCQTKSMIAQDWTFLELQRDEREYCRLTKTQTINGAACLRAMMATLTARR